MDENITSIDSTTKLNNGEKMPWLGFGTFKIPDGKMAMKSVTMALDAGYKSIDTAAYYKNEESVGKAIRWSEHSREEIFLTTKVWDLGYENTVKALDNSLKKLKMDYVDLYLIHWPRKGLIKETWKAMEDIHEQGKARSIGVSNFMIPHLIELFEDANVIPAVDQVEFHPYLVQKELLDFCNDKDIQLEAWSPLMQGDIIKVRELELIAEKYQKTQAQVALRWDLQHGVVTIPKSVRNERIQENMNIFDFEISKKDMKLIDLLENGKRYGPDPYVMYY